jgi:hypothetical protein
MRHQPTIMGATKHFHTCRIDDPHEKNGRGRIDVFSSCSAHQRRCMWHPQYAASNCPLSLGARIGLGVSRKALSPLRSQWTFNPVVPAGAVSPHRQRVVHGLLLWMSLEPRSLPSASSSPGRPTTAFHNLPPSPEVRSRTLASHSSLLGRWEAPHRHNATMRNVAPIWHP